MTIGQALASAAIIVPAFTAFLVAYWHRKQLRQIEAYRKDPSVGLTPPPSALWTFVSSRWKLLLTAGVPALLIGLQFYFKVPVTLTTVFLMALNMTSIVAAFLLELIEKVVRVVGRIVELQADMLHTEHEHLSVTAKVANAVLSEKSPGAGA
jgi:hypothetical protein